MKSPTFFLSMLCFLLFSLASTSCSSKEYAKAQQPNIDRSYLLDASLQAEDLTGLPPHNGGANTPELSRKQK
jgi:hypothetical protein